MREQFALRVRADDKHRVVDVVVVHHLERVIPLAFFVVVVVNYPSPIFLSSKRLRVFKSLLNGVVSRVFTLFKDIVFFKICFFILLCF